MSSSSYGFYVSQWQTNKNIILQLRESVLIDEFGVQDEDLQNLNDPESFHIIAYDGDSNPIATGCMTNEGVISHVVVLKQWRRRTIGKAIVIYLMNIAKINNLPCVMANVPDSIVGFFDSLNFENTDVVDTYGGVRYQKLVRLVSKPKDVIH